MNWEGSREDRGKRPSLASHASSDIDLEHDSERLRASLASPCVSGEEKGSPLWFNDRHTPQPSPPLDEVERSSIDQLKILHSVFNVKGKTVSYSDIVMYLSIEQKWGEPAKVRQLLKDAEIRGWIRTTGQDSTKTAELLVCAEAALN